MPGDDVTSARRRTPDDRPCRVIATDNAVVIVAHCSGARGIQTDVIAPDDVAHRRIAPKFNPRPAVGRNHISIARRGAANRVAAGLDVNAVFVVAGSGRAIGRHTDVVSGNQVVAAPGQRNA